MQWDLIGLSLTVCARALLHIRVDVIKVDLYEKVEYECRRADQRYHE